MNEKVSKSKKIFKVIYLLIGLLLPLPINYISDVVHKYAIERYDALLPIIVSLIIYFLIGIYLGFDSLINNIKSDGKWAVKWRRLIVGFVFLVLSLAVGLPVISLPINEFLFYNFRYTYFIWTIIAGYLVITSFLKENQADDSCGEKLNI